MNFRSALTLCAVLGLAGCAAAQPSRSGDQQQQQVPPGPTDAEDEEAMKAAVEDLSTQKRASLVPRASSDCQPLCRIGELICAASDKICAIADRHRNDRTYAEQCRTSEQDCKSARSECDTCQ